MTIVPIEQIKCATFPPKRLTQKGQYNNNEISTIYKCGVVDQNKQEIVEDGITAEGMGKMQRPKHPTSYFETLVHLLKANIASGMLAMGDAYKNAGLLFGPFLTVVLGLICVFNQHILINCANLMRETNKLDYYPGFDDTMKLCFEAGPPLFKKYSKFAKFSVNLFIIMAQLGFCCVYFVFISSTTKQVLDLYSYEIDIHLHMVGVLVCLVGFVLIRNLKFMVPVSFVAMVIMFVGVAVTLYISSQDLPSPSSRTWLASISTLPLFFGTAIYAFEGISLVLPLQVEMKHPEKFNSPLGVLNCGMSITTVLLIVVGSIGYLKYGEDIKGSITLNLPPTEVLSQCIKLAIGISIIMTYPLMFYIPFTLIWKQVKRIWGPFEKPLLYEHSLRLALVFVTLTSKMEPKSFYGKSKRVVLPPVNQQLSDEDISSDSEPEIFADNSDEDPDYSPEVPSSRGGVRFVEETDSDSQSEDFEHSQTSPSTSTAPRPAARTIGHQKTREFKWVKQDIPSNTEANNIHFEPETNIAS